ncbi:GtrA family protein [Winogradskyella sp.]|uniref:GtrA family protein n=1 Tax=Winogradskyella sp. TaxID=1883156 RepID=UPI003BAC1256
MLIIALLGVVLGFITYELIYYLNPLSPRATLSWTLAFLIGIWRQHALHRRFTFLNQSPYFESLIKAYIADIGVLVMSTLLNWWLSEILGLSHRLVWFICLIVASMASFVCLKGYVFKVKRD